MKGKWELRHCDLDLWPKVTKFNRVRASAGSIHSAKTASITVHFRTHRQTHCSENITPPWFRGGVKIWRIQSLAVSSIILYVQEIVVITSPQQRDALYILNQRCLLTMSLLKTFSTQVCWLSSSPACSEISAKSLSRSSWMLASSSGLASLSSTGNACSLTYFTNAFEWTFFCNIHWNTLDVWYFWSEHVE